MLSKLDIKLKILENAKDIILPSYETSGSAGMDLRAAISESVVLKPNSTFLISTGLCIQLPVGYEAQVRSRSGLAAKNSVFVLNSPGTIDSDYRGEIKVILMNLSDSQFVVNRGDRIAQMVISQYAVANFKIVDCLDDSSRGSSGFGSTGIS